MLVGGVSCSNEPTLLWLPAVPPAAAAIAAAAAGQQLLATHVTWWA